MPTRTDARPREVDEWLQKLGSDQQEQAEQLAALVHAADSEIAEAVKWRRLTFTVHDNWHHWLCAVAVSRGGAKLVFHKGALLRDPDGLLQGESRYLREIPYDAAAAHSKAATALVREAIVHQTDMLDD
ncbi:MAG TPA: DUF1801 domain-containing protein [Chloroflexota bacterium]|nr:DUF1801 domain-containing protein [Chloroflexota bacterium]